jgi:hypothetical protein
MKDLKTISCEHGVHQFEEIHRSRSSVMGADKVTVWCSHCGTYRQWLEADGRKHQDHYRVPELIRDFAATAVASRGGPA